VLLVPKNSPYRTVKDLVKASKESPNGLTYGTSGVGTSVHLAGELFKAMSGANMEVIFFKGDSESLVNLVGGHIPVSVNTVPGAKQQIDAGNVRALGVTTKQRVPVLGNVPTISEAGVENYEMSTWFGILGPKGMKKEDVQRINADIRKAMNDPELSRQLTSQGMIVNVGTPEEFDGLIRGEIKKWRPIVEKLGLKKDS
jgi:tripartite-type tricarboxylate transporter receptor subunit TctC